MTSYMRAEYSDESALTATSFEGGIPTEIAELTKLTWLRTHNNQLTGLYPQLAWLRIAFVGLDHNLCRRH